MNHNNPICKYVGPCTLRDMAGNCDQYLKNAVEPCIYRGCIGENRQTHPVVEMPDFEEDRPFY